MLIALALLKVGISFKTSLWILRKFVLPKPGQGPNLKAWAGSNSKFGQGTNVNSF